MTSSALAPAASSGIDPDSETVALDASVLINFLILDRVDLFRGLPGLEFVIPQAVENEIRDPRYPKQQKALRQSLDVGDIRVERIESLTEIEAVTLLRKVLGAGESECLVLAQARGWMVACDERGRFRRLADERVGEARITTTPDLMLRAICANLLTVEEADAMKARLEKHRFRMPFDSFRERLG